MTSDRIHVARFTELTPAVLYGIVKLRQDVFVVEQACAYDDMDGRYASVVWGPLFPVLGAGLALIADRRIAAGLLATSAVASIALSAVVTHPDTPAAVAALQREVAADGLVDAYPSQYLLLLYYGDASLAARTHIVSRRVDWFWGTAAYPPGAVIDAVPPGVSTVYFLAQPDDPRPPAQIAPGYRRRGGRCWTGVCVTTYSRATA